MNHVPKDVGSTSACDACELHTGGDPAGGGRRDFLRRAAMLLAATGMGMLQVQDADAQPEASTPADAAGAAQGPDERRYAIPGIDGVSIDRDNSLIIARTAGRVYAFSLACPHQNTALRWDAGSTEYRCPKHKSRYRADGTFIDGRATRSMDRLPIRRDGQALVVDLDTIFEQDAQPALWAAAYVTV